MTTNPLDCPECGHHVTWDNGDKGDRHHPLEPPGWECKPCCLVWDADGPEYEESIDG